MQLLAFWSERSVHTVDQIEKVKKNYHILIYTYDWIMGLIVTIEAVMVVVPN